MNRFQKLIPAAICYIGIALSAFPFQTSLYAQRSEKSDHLVTMGGDTLYGEVQYIDEGIPRKFYSKVRLITSTGKQRKFNKKNVAAFSKSNSSYESFWLDQASHKISLVSPKYVIDRTNGEHYFLKVLSKGSLSHYELEWMEQGEVALRSMALLKKETDAFFIRADQGILGLKRKLLIDYFSDCQQMQEAITHKEVNDVREVVDFYNQNCAD